MAETTIPNAVIQPITGPIDCACVIHGTAYTWNYVERLYSMLQRHISPDIRMHVYTEASRTVPDPYIKHALEDWGFTGPKKSWWYKIQLFNPEHHRGALLYFDLDTVIVGNINWMWQLPLQYYWTVRDFKSLWRDSSYSVNSSAMWFDTSRFEYVWTNFKNQGVNKVVNIYRGDQDFITEAIPQSERRFFEHGRVRSWRWECLDGGYDFNKRRYLKPNTGTDLPDRTSVLIFHGRPKPDQILDPVITQHWQ